MPGASGTGGRPEACHAGSDTSVFFKALERFTVRRKLRQEDDHFQASLNYSTRVTPKKKGKMQDRRGRCGYREEGREHCQLALSLSGVAQRGLVVLAALSSSCLFTGAEMRRQEESSALGSTPQAWEPGGFVLYGAGAFPCSCFFICLGPIMAEPVYKPWRL